MKDGAEVVMEAERVSRIDMREKEIASVILKALSDNKATVAEAIRCLRLAEDAIKQVRLSAVNSL